MEEIWKPIKGYEGYYEVSNLGRVKSVERHVKWMDSTRFVKERIKSININVQGYVYVTLCKDRKSRSALIHRLVAEAFIPNPDNKPFVDHINTIRTDNRVENLRWVTNQENCNNPITLQNARKNNYSKDVCAKSNETKRERGTINAPKYVYQYDMSGNFINKYISIQEAMRITGVHSSAIGSVCRGKRYSAGGYIWKFDESDNVAYGRPRSPKAKRVLQYTRNGEFIKEWDCLMDVCKVYGSTPSNLSKRIHRNNFRGKYIWKFKEQT